MAVLGTGALTYADWAKRVEDDKIAVIINLLSQTNEIMLDMLVLEGNLPTGHKTTVRTGLPAATWRLLNYGVGVGKSTTAQVVDACGMLETYSVIDKSLADLNGNTAAFRMSEDMAFLEGMSQQMAQTLIYGNTSVNPERFMGLAPRYSSVSVNTAQTAANVIDCGGTGSTNTSIWIVTWGQRTCHGIFPKGQKAGLHQEDATTAAPVFDANGNRYQAYQTHFKWDIGLTVRDWRFVVRLANIDVSLLNGVSAANLINSLVRGLHRLPVAPVTASTEQTSDDPSISGTMGNTVIYCNRTVRTYLDLQAMNRTNMFLTLGEYNGVPITKFRGIPIRTVDAILSTEARVV